MNNNASEEQNTNSRSEPHRTTRHKPPLYFTSLSERVKEMPKMRVSLGARGRGAITAPPAVAGARQEALYGLKHLVTHSRSHLAHPTLSPSAPPLRTVAGGRGRPKGASFGVSAEIEASRGTERFRFFLPKNRKKPKENFRPKDAFSAEISRQITLFRPKIRPKCSSIGRNWHFRPKFLFRPISASGRNYHPQN